MSYGRGLAPPKYIPWPPRSAYTPLAGKGFATIDSRFNRLEDRFDRLEDRFDRFDIKFIGHLSSHGERLARIEVELNIDPPPPAEAA